MEKSKIEGIFKSTELIYSTYIDRRIPRYVLFNNWLYEWNEINLVYVSEVEDMLDIALDI